MRGLAEEGAAWHRAGTQIMALRRLRPRRRSGSGDVHLHRHRQAQRRRPAGLACRRPRSHRRAAADPSAGTPALALEGRPSAGPGRVAGTLHSRLTKRPAPARSCRMRRGLHRMLTNKRTALYLVELLAQRSGYEFVEDDEVIAHTITSVARGETQYEDLAEWFRTRLVRPNEP